MRYLKNVASELKELNLWLLSLDVIDVETGDTFRNLFSLISLKNIEKHWIRPSRIDLLFIYF